MVVAAVSEAVRGAAVAAGADCKVAFEQQAKINKKQQHKRRLWRWWEHRQQWWWCWRWQRRRGQIVKQGLKDRQQSTKSGSRNNGGDGGGNIGSSGGICDGFQWSEKNSSQITGYYWANIQRTCMSFFCREVQQRPAPWALDFSQMKRFHCSFWNWEIEQGGGHKNWHHDKHLMSQRTGQHSTLWQQFTTAYSSFYTT